MLSNWIVELFHWQWTLINAMHAVFIPLTMGLSLFIAALETAAVFTDKPIYKQAIDFWKRLFALNLVFMLGARLPWLLQFGFYDAYFSHYAGDVFALPLALESVTSLATIATLFGPYWFGWDKIGKYPHLGCTWLITIGVHASVFWITTSNAWLENPVGVEFNPNTYRLEMMDFGAVLNNPILLGKFLHLCVGSHAAAAGAVLAVEICHPVQKSSNPITKPNFRIAAVWGLLSLAVSLISTSNNPPPTLDTPAQTAKWAILNGHLPPRMQQELEQHIKQGIEAYRALQILRDDNQDARVISIFDAYRADLGYAWLLKPIHKPIIDASDKQIQLAAQAALPRNLTRLYWLQRMAFILGITCLLGFAWMAWQSLRGKQTSHFVRNIVLSLGALPWLNGALDLWLNLEVQKPWLIAGQLPISMGLSTLTINTLIISLTAHIGIYALMLIGAGQLLKLWITTANSVESGAKA